jgi:hypothetical protein
MRILLAAKVDRDDVERALLGVGMRLIAVLPKGEAHPAQLVFLGDDERTVAHWVVDDRSSSTFLVLAGPDVARVGRGARALPHTSVESSVENSGETENAS